VSWIQTLVQRWRSRNLTLVCPNCRKATSLEAFRRARYRLGDDELTCEQCDKASNVTLWRFAGLSGASTCHRSGVELPLAN